MKLNYNIKIDKSSVSVNNTPSLSAQRLPFYTTASGHYYADKMYFTEREGLENSCLVFYTLAGRGRLKYRNYDGDLLPGKAAIIRCAEYQYYGTASEEPWEFKWAHIGGMMAAEYEERINKGALNPVMLEQPSRTEAALDSILFLLKDKEDPLADIRISGALSELLTEVASHKPRPSAQEMLHQQEMEAALSYIRANYSQRIGVDDIIARVNLSKYYFLRQFKAYTGLGVYECLNHQRIDIAKQLLKDTACTVGEVALSVGFGDVNCFIRYFKKVTGVTPATFRKYYLY